MIFGRLPLFNIHLVLAGICNTLYNVLFSYGIVKGVPGIAAGISSNFCIWIAVLDYLYRGVLLSGLDLIAIALLSSGSMISALS